MERYLLPCLRNRRKAPMLPDESIMLFFAVFLVPVAVLGFDNYLLALQVLPYVIGIGGVVAIGVYLFIMRRHF